MSEENQAIGQRLYAMGDDETRQWLEKQWRIWPERADERLTTNIALHYGGVLGYRAEHGCDPTLSDSFRVNVDYMDRYLARTLSDGKGE